MDKETRLGLIASAILDGTPVDWPAAESTAAADELDVVKELRVLAEIAALHRVSPAADAPRAVQPSAPARLQWAHLRLLERVGSGTFGEVFRAWDTHLDREVALKLLRARPVPGEASASLSDPVRVVNEGRLLARIRHPHVITVYGADTRDGTVGIWMEFIRGRTLHELVADQGPMSAREAAGIGADLCRALAAVHAAGLLHRDVTARNVMREEGGRVVLMDFGAGHEHRTLGGASAAGIAGTPVYIAPELFKRAEADQRTDIYALGVLVFYLVAGRFPIVGRSLDEIRDAHDRGTSTRLRDVRPDLPAPFVRAVERAVDPDPARRYATAGGFEAALEEALRGRHVPAPVSGRRAITLAAWAAALVLAVTGAIWSIAARDSRSPAGAAPARVAAPAGVVLRKLQQPPGGFWPFSNPSDDGRYMAGMVTQTGDVGLIDLDTGKYRALGMGPRDFSQGYASLGALSPDGTAIAVDWHDDSGGSLRVIRSDGSGLRTLIPTPGDVWVHGWSRDNALILTLVEPPGGPASIGLVAAADGAIRTIRQLGAARPDVMSLSPDGRYIAYDYPESETSDDRDIYVLDAHTGRQWAVAPSSGQDSSPYWSPDGTSLVFLSDRSRTTSLWRIPMHQGRPAGEPVLLRDDVGRVWLRGFTASGLLHYYLTAGYAEIYIASLDAASRPQVVSPRRAFSNFYPKWSPDGRYLAYSSERTMQNGRDLWVYDTQEGRETRVPLSGIGAPIGWSPDGTQILAVGADQAVFLIDIATGRSRALEKNIARPVWGPAGIVYARPKQIVVFDPVSWRAVQTRTYDDPSLAGFGHSPDGRSILTLWKDGRVAVQEVSTGLSFQWQDAPGAGLASIYTGTHLMRPNDPGIVYAVMRKGINGESKSLMFWGGSGSPRELLRISTSEQFTLVGWEKDGRTLLITRWSPPNAAAAARTPVRTIWRVPTSGAPPVPTHLSMPALRDVSLHPDGWRLAFNAGFKESEQWVMENLLTP